MGLRLSVFQGVCVGVCVRTCTFTQSSTLQFQPLATWAGGGLTCALKVQVGHSRVTSTPEVLLVVVTNGGFHHI